MIPYLQLLAIPPYIMFMQIVDQTCHHHNVLVSLRKYLIDSLFKNLRVYECTIVG